MELWVILSLFLIAIFAVCIIWSEGLIKYKSRLIISIILVSMAFVLRGFGMEHVTLDYTTFLSKWMEYFRENGGFAAISEQIGNYNLPYLYFLALFSYIDESDFYLIKLLSVFFDVVWPGLPCVFAGCFLKAKTESCLLSLLYFCFRQLY